METLIWPHSQAARLKQSREHCLGIVTPGLFGTSLHAVSSGSYILAQGVAPCRGLHMARLVPVLHCLRDLLLTPCLHDLACLVLESKSCVPLFGKTLADPCGLSVRLSVWAECGSWQTPIVSFYISCFSCCDPSQP